MNPAWNIAAIFFAQIASSASRTLLRLDFAYVAAGVALLAIALAAIALFFFRRRTGDPTLIYFGLFCTLYAVRLLIFSAAFRALFEEPRSFWNYVTWIITCTIIIPASLFFYQVARERSRNLIRWLLTAQAIFAVLGILAAALGENLDTLFTANSAAVLGMLVLTMAYLMVDAVLHGLPKHLTNEVRVLVVGFVVWLVFIVHANLLGLGILHGHNFEFVGFLVFVGALGYVAAYRTFANEEKLVAINKELEIARGIQASTLPQNVPTLAGIVIAARYAPMSAVAGDFYDFLCVDEKRVGVLVADVTGHGVPAALIASMLKVAFAGQAEHAHDPARLLASLNRALCGKFEEHFVTAAYLFVDVGSGLLRYSAAGHPPMLLASRSERNVRDIEENGLMLGMFPEAAYTSIEVKMNAGDRCLLYTDGVFEAKNGAQEEYGRARCHEFMLAHGDASATAFVNALFEDVARFSGLSSGRAQEDDVTLVVVDIT
jgi:phosphoserine phosphatase RsbU/P